MSRKMVLGEEGDSLGSVPLGGRWGSRPGRGGNVQQKGEKVKKRQKKKKKKSKKLKLKQAKKEREVLGEEGDSLGSVVLGGRWGSRPGGVEILQQEGGEVRNFWKKKSNYSRQKKKDMR